MEDSAEVTPTMIKEGGSLQILAFDSSVMSNPGFLGRSHIWEGPLPSNNIKPTSQMGFQKDEVHGKDQVGLGERPQPLIQTHAKAPNTGYILIAGTNLGKQDH